MARAVMAPEVLEEVAYPTREVELKISKRIS